MLIPAFQRRALILLVAVAPVLAVTGCSDKPDVKANAEIKISNWGPQETQAGLPFNVQPTGKSAFWIQVTGVKTAGGVQVLLGDKPLEDIAATDALVTAAVPNALIEAPGERALILVEGEGGRRVTVGTFKVLPK